MPPDERRLLLEGPGGRFVIGADFWAEIVDWAAQQGWIPEENREGLGLQTDYSSQEASRLAEALDFIGGSLIIHSHTDVSTEFIGELGAALHTLQQFAESGGFCVLPWPGPGESSVN